MFVKKVNNIISFIAFFFIFSLTSCDKIGETKKQVVEPYLAKEEIPAKEGFVKLEFYDKLDLGWEAEIVEGEGFLSFSLSESVNQKTGKVEAIPKPNFIYLYFSENRTPEERKAKIGFKYLDGRSYEIELSQAAPDVGAASSVWPELPETIQGEGYYYVTHNVKVEGKDIRNYSMCFDPKSYAALWVAFPYHLDVYDGVQTRTDDWEFDPEIPREYQPDLHRSYNGDYDRGHQLASADRTKNREMNSQTFYYSNMTPQMGRLNQQQWAKFEMKVRDNVCSDTLYVVTGADYTTSIGSTYDAAGKKVPLPGGYYKVLLRTKSGRTGKSISECRPEELMAIGFYFDHRFYSSMPQEITVDEMEKKTGFNFFPSIDESVEKRVNINDWNL